MSALWEIVVRPFTFERWHGTIGGYTNHSCRCEDCMAAMRAYRSRAKAGPIPPTATHGLSTYQNYGCRCSECRAGRRAYDTRRKAMRSAAVAP